MDALDRLEAWLERPVYEDGVLLYQELIGPGFVLDMLKTGPDAYNRGKLRATLEQKRSELASEQLARQESYPQPLVSSLDQAKSLMDQRTVLKERLRMSLNSGINHSEDTKDWTFEILNIGDQLKDIYGQKDFFDQHGYLPEPIDETERTPEQVLQRILTLRTFVTRYGKKLRRPMITEDQQQNWLAKLQQYQSELHELSRQFSPDSTSDENFL